MAMITELTYQTSSTVILCVFYFPRFPYTTSSSEKPQPSKHARGCSNREKHTQSGEDF